MQFDLNRNIDAAARDVQAAINAARSQLPANLPGNPTYRKVNPADAPILILALTSDIITLPRMYDAADSILSQKLAQVEGVGQVFAGGGAKPAVRAELNPTLLNKLGVGLDTVRTALGNANANRPKGAIDGPVNAWTLDANDQIFTADQYRRLIVSYNNGAPVRLGDVGSVYGFGGRHPQYGAVQREARRPDHRLPPAGREHHRDRGPRARHIARC